MAAFPEIDQQAVIDRIHFLIENMRLSQAAFARRLRLDPGNLSKHLSGRLPITKGLVNRIAVDLAVSKHWLLTGEGVPFEKPLPPTESAKAEFAVAAPQKGTPIYDIDVTAGCLSLSQMFTEDRIIGFVDLPTLRSDSVIVRVFGDSMMPEIPDGAYVAIRHISDTSCIFWGQIYVVILDDYRMVKHIRRHADPDKLILRSANPAYDDLEINRSQVRNLFLVETILNLTTRC